MRTSLTHSFPMHCFSNPFYVYIGSKWVKGKEFTGSKYCFCESIRPFHFQMFFVKENTPENGE